MFVIEVTVTSGVLDYNILRGVSNVLKLIS